jgi:hypothetical protein
MQIRTSDRIILDDILGVRESICAIQKTKALKAFSTLKEYVTYDGHKVKAKSPASLKNSIPALLQDLELYDLEGKIYSGNGSIFVKEFAECLTCFLKGFSILLCENKIKQRIKRITITALELADGLRWLTPVMKATRCCRRSREIQIGNIIRKLENQGAW